MLSSLLVIERRVRTPTRTVGAVHLLRQRSFALLFAGSAINAIGSWCALMALWGFAAYRFDASPGQIALLILSWAVPGAATESTPATATTTPAARRRRRRGARRALAIAWIVGTNGSTFNASPRDPAAGGGPTPVRRTTFPTGQRSA